jgi:hypothetical protein
MAPISRNCLRETVVLTGTSSLDRVVIETEVR